MNKRESYSRLNRALQYFDHGNRFGSHVNCLRLNVANSLEHELKKFELAYSHLMQGKPFLTEAIFVDRRGRADFVNLDDRIIVEILHSETEKDLNTKIEKYPRDFRVERVWATK